MTFSQFFFKVKSRLWYCLVQYTRNKTVYPLLYKSYWHYILPKSKKNTGNATCYFTACPNPGAGIGHQLSNWNAGYWFAKQFGLNFAHIPFSTQKWEDFLGFGEGEKKMRDLVISGYRLRKLPIFNEYNPQELTLTKAIIQSYAGKKIVLLTEQDQGYKDQFGVMEEIRQKFHHAPSRRNDQIVYNPAHFNVACHVRRGDIAAGKHKNDPSCTTRWLDSDYYTTVLSLIIKNVKTNKPITVYLFSEGEQKDFQEFEQFPDIHWCLDMSAQNTFLHMVYADLLITSKSSFSYKPALMNDGIKVCPRDFWHSYPNQPKWILVENDGTFDTNRLNNVF